MKQESLNLLTFAQFVEKHPWSSEGGLRWLRFHCETNGYGSAFVNIGSRVYIDEAEFFRCVERENGREAAIAG